DRDQHVVAGEMLLRLAGRHELAAALVVAHRLDLLEQHAGEAAVFVGEFLRHEVVEDRDALVHGVLLLPGRRLHLLEAGAHHDLDVLAAEPARRAAAVHGGVAAAQHDHALADLVDVAERHAGEPVDADMDVGGRLLAAGNVEIATARRAAPDEHRVPTLRQQRFEAIDAFAATELDAEIEDVIAFLVDDGLGQTKARDLRADHATRLRILVEHDAMIAEGGEIPRDRKRGGAAAHERNALAVLDRRRLGQALANILLEVGGDAFQPTNSDGLILHAHAAAGGLARPVAGAAENSGKHVGFPVDHVGVAVAASGDHPDVFGNGRVRRTGPLAVHDLVEVVRPRNVGRFHLRLCTPAWPRPTREPCANKRRPVCPPASACGPPNPARIVVEPPSKFHRYIRHNRPLRDNEGATRWFAGNMPQASGPPRKKAVTRLPGAIRY